MKKVFTIVAVMALLSSACFAQVAARRGQSGKPQLRPVAAFKSQIQKQSAKSTAKAAGDTVSNYPWVQGFEGGTLGFTFVDSDNDGFNWSVMSTSIENISVNSGDKCVTSLSYDNDNQVALTPDNWMILPVMQIPSNATEFTLSWYEKGQDASYCAENYSVYITTTGHAVGNFTTTTAVYSGTATATWVKRSVDISSYAGQAIHIAFRHHNVTDMFMLNIDDIRVGGPEMPSVSVSGPVSVIANMPVTYTATSSASNYSWFVDGVAQTAVTGNTMTTTFATVGTHQVVASVSNTVGTASDTLDVNVIECDVITGTYNEGFESLNPCWQFVSANTSNDAYVGLTDNSYSGSSAFTFSSYASAADYNQFLISPQLNLAGSSYMVSFWYRGFNSGDSFRVKVSTTTSDTAAFTTVLADYPTVSTEWTFVALQLPADAKYIAINYYGNYAYYLYVDDFSIAPMGTPIISLSGVDSIGTGIEATFSATVALANTTNWYVDDAPVAAEGNTLTYIFTTAGEHSVVFSATNDNGTSFDTLMVDVFSCDGYTIPYAPDFTNGFGCWVSRSYKTESGWFASQDVFGSEPQGQVASFSAESFMGRMLDVPIDNWLFSPSIAMPSNGTYEIAWSVKPYSVDFPTDHYGVYVIQGNDTTLLFEETLNRNMTDFAQRAFEIPATINGNFHVAFRHWDCTGGYLIILDDIELRNLSAPIVTIEGPVSAPVDADLTFTAQSSTATSFSWTVDGNTVAEGCNTLTTSFSTTGNHTVAVTATNAVGSTTAIATVNIFSCDAITSFPFVADFEDEEYDYSCWRFIDADGDGYNWDTDFLRGMTDDQGNPSPMGHNGSNGLVASASYVNNVGPLTPDNWMVLPAMTLPQDETISLSWYAKGQDATYAAENYSVYVSATGSNISDFTSQLYTGVTTNEWTKQTVSLADYAGQTVNIAFRHHDVTDMFYLVIDDIRVAAGNEGISDIENSNISIYPNPATDMVTVGVDGADGNVNVQIVDINGRIVKEQNGNAQGMNIEVGNLSRGIYFVRLTGETVNIVRKLVLE